MPPERPLNPTLLVTLVCPNRNCRKRVAVMDHFPTGKEKPGDITLIDGRTADRVDKLICRKCFTGFPPIKAYLPEHLFVKPGAEPPPPPTKSHFDFDF